MTTTGRPETLCEAFHDTVSRHGSVQALRQYGEAKSYTWAEYADRVRRIAEGLHAIGVRRGDTVALMLANRPEFNFCDTGAMMLGATPFSVYNTNPADTVAYQLDNADAEVCVCEPSTYPAVAEAAAAHPRLRTIVVVADAVPALPDASVEAPGPEVLTLTELESRRDSDFDYTASWQAVEPDDLLTIIFTSGTTGKPKGVELTHRNLVANMAIIEQIGGIDETDRAISYLPDAHIANRFITYYSAMTNGTPVISVREQAQVLEAMVETRPTIFLGVPRLWGKLATALTERIHEEPRRVVRLLGRWALSCGQRATTAQMDSGSVPRALRFEHALAERLVLHRIRRQIGMDECRMALSGAAPIPEETQLFVLSLGIPLCNGWGMSEATTGLTLQRPGRAKIGSVGTAIDGVELSLAEDGELLARGQMVMRGYRKEPTRTAETVDQDGWLHTGDLGEIASDGEVRIIGRKKEIIINAAGKNMAPAKIEGAVGAVVPLAAYVMVVGEGRPYNTMLVGLDEDVARARLAAAGYDVDEAANLARHPVIRAEIQQGIDTANQSLSRTEQIKCFEIVPDIWEPGGPYVTPTLKVRRAPVEQGYADLVSAMYESGHTQAER